MREGEREKWREGEGWGERGGERKWKQTAADYIDISVSFPKFAGIPSPRTRKKQEHVQVPLLSRLELL